MQVDFLIVGQGLSGSWLSYEAKQAGARVCVIDQIDPGSPSRRSAGIINPITGRRHVEVWLAEAILQHAQAAYGSLAQQLNRSLLRKTDLLDYFPSEQMRSSFLERIQKGGRYVRHPDEPDRTESILRQPFGIGRIDPVYLVDLPAFLEGWREALHRTDSLLDIRFDPDQLQLSAGSIRYQGIQAERIFFCDGVGGLNDRFFPNLPFAPNKGEVLILEIPDLPTEHLYKHGLMLAPLSNGTWWVGSSYQWRFDHTNPTPAFRELTERTLDQWLKIPYRVLDHVAGVRPATLQRRPFVGLHPQDPRIGILNGMGTKGCSLAPYFAHQLIQHVTNGHPIHPEAALNRFAFPSG